MINVKDLCMNCFRENQGKKICPHCGYNADTPQLPPYLPTGTLVAGHYVIGRGFERGGDGATYFAWDAVKRTSVLVREFLPDSIAARHTGNLGLTITLGCENLFREYNQSFVELWTKLARVSGQPCIAAVSDIVSDNGTSYAVYERIAGVTLREYLMNFEQGCIPWDRARQLFMPLLSTLGALHKVGIVHRGISPTTLIVGQDGRLKLTGFCIGQARTLGGKLNAQLFDGYAAVEQYGFNGQQGAWTDIYSFGATLYRALVGSDPMTANSRLTNDRLMIPAKIAEQLPDYVINGLVNSLQILPEDRTRNIEQLRAEFSASPSTVVPQERTAAPTPRSGETRSQREVKPAVSNVKNDRVKKVKKNKQKSFTVLKTALICIAAGIVLIIVGSYLLPPEYDDYNIVRQMVQELTGKPFVRNEAKEEETDLSDINSGELITVPKLIGKAKAEIEANAYYISAFNIEYQEAFSEDVEEGFIISQSLTAGGKVPKGETLVIVVSKGMPYVEMPTVVGLRYEDAVKILQKKGFVVESGSVTYKVNDGAHTAGTIFKSDKNVGEEYRKGSTVALVVWDEIESEVVTTNANIVTNPGETTVAVQP